MIIKWLIHWKKKIYKHSRLSKWNEENFFQCFLCLFFTNFKPVRNSGIYITKKFDRGMLYIYSNLYAGSGVEFRRCLNSDTCIVGINSVIVRNLMPTDISAEIIKKLI